ncbi:MAG: hypothetical protein ACI3XQ_04660 [Eubacteriales bacterium]
MNNNNTVNIGLPYTAEWHDVSDFATQSLTVDSFSAACTMTDANGYIDSDGGGYTCTNYRAKLIPLKLHERLHRLPPVNCPQKCTNHFCASVYSDYSSK